MPAPATAAELLELVQRSGVVDETKLRAYIQKLNTSGSLPADPAMLAGILVRDGVLTYFQAEQLLQGKYKRFTIGKYKVLEKLGAGGMAQVFLCEHKLMRRRVAIKVLPTAKADDPSSLDRFYREARAVAAVDHPNIVRAYDIDQDENLHFLVMEYVDGTNLQELVKKFGPLDVLRACHYIYGASVGLQHAHEIGLVHRDIKPGNILVERAGVVKILDMGLARFFHDEDDQLTRQNDENVLGTADYLAPEQALDSHGVDIRADIYSLGATFYYLLTGSAPFPEGSVAQKLIWHQNRQPRPLKSLRPDVPDEIVAIVERMMAKKPEARYQTPADVMAALGPWVATPVPPPDEREMPQLSAAAGGTSGNSGANRAPTTMIGPVAAPTTSPAGGLPLAGLTGSDGGSTGVSAATDPGTPNPLVWEALSREDDTQSVARGDTDRTRPQSAPRPRREDEPAVPHRKILYLVPVALLAVAAGLYFVVFNKQSPPPPPPGTDGPRRLIVSKSPGENHFATLRDALSSAAPGDTIVITETTLSENMLRLSPTKHRDLTIEGAGPGGVIPVIVPNSQIATMFDVAGADGVTIKNLVFDGQDKVEVGLNLSGECQGVKIENITVRGAKVANVRFRNASGGVDRPIVLDRLRTVVGTSPQGQVGLLMQAENVDTRHVRVRNSRFEGAVSGFGVRVDGPATDVELTGNRFYSLDTAVSFGKIPRAKVVQANATENTFCNVKVGVGYDTTPAVSNEPIGTFRIDVTRNYFGKTSALSSFTGPTAPAVGKSADNAFGVDSKQGTLALTATQIPQLLLPPDSNNDATFLRFPAGQPEVAGKKVGAP